jgi:hypothetical protein
VGYHCEPFVLGIAPITVHKDSSQQHASLGKATLTGYRKLSSCHDAICGRGLAQPSYIIGETRPRWCGCDIARTQSEFSQQICCG